MRPLVPQQDAYGTASLSASLFLIGVWRQGPCNYGNEGGVINVWIVIVLIPTKGKNNSSCHPLCTRGGTDAITG